jgi:hypothetical protein
MLLVDLFAHHLRSLCVAGCCHQGRIGLRDGLCELGAHPITSNAEELMSVLGMAVFHAVQANECHAAAVTAGLTDPIEHTPMLRARLRTLRLPALGERVAQSFIPLDPLFPDFWILAIWAFSERLDGIGALLANCFAATCQNAGHSTAFGL